MILEELLRGYDMNVLSAEDGDKALEMFEHCIFDAAIVDMQMPKMGGLDVIREYNAGNGLFKKIPFIVLTANATANAKRECEQAGAVAYMKKPVDENELLQLIFKHTKTEFDRPNLNQTDTIQLEQTTNEQQIDILDMHTIQKLKTISTKEGVFEKFVTNYLHDLHISLQVVERAVSASDYIRYHDETHAIKGASANIGAQEVFHVAKLANNDHKIDFDSCGRTRYEHLVKAVDNVESAFKELLNGSKTVD
jgi:two-component system sensor histidine kinase RpfC